MAAILSYDIAGYSRLMGVDERRTLERLKAHRRNVIEPKADRHGGRIVKLMGDGALMEFASVSDAVTFAVAMQFAVRETQVGVASERQLLYRIGINLGDVIVDDDDIYGDGVNVAARLEALSEPGGVCIRRNVRDEIRGKLDLDVEDLGEIEVKNIERPVRTFRVIMNDKAAALARAPTHRPPERKPASRPPDQRAAAVIGRVLKAAVGLWRTAAVDTGSGSTLAGNEAAAAVPSIAVLPFRDLSSDPSQSYFVAGLTNDVTADLGRFRSLRVAGSSAVFGYARDSLNPTEIGRALSVDYILDGTVEKAGEQLRVSVQLTEAETGTQLWTKRFDRRLIDLFAVRDEISQAIAGALTGHTGPITRAEQTRAASLPENRLTARDLYYKAYAEFSKFGADANAAAHVLLDRSIERDSNELGPHWLLGWVYWREIFIFGVGDRSDALRAGLAEARKSIELDPSDYRGHWLLGAMLRLAKDNNAAAAAYERAATLNPNDPDMLADWGEFLSYTGQPETAIPQIKRAIELNPAYPAWYHSILQRAFYNARQYEQVIEIAGQGDPRIGSLENLAASLAQLDNTETAKPIIDEILAREPARSIRAFVAAEDLMDKALLDHFVDGLRKAGLPE